MAKIIELVLDIYLSFYHYFFKMWDVNLTESDFHRGVPVQRTQKLNKY